MYENKTCQKCEICVLASQMRLLRSVPAEAVQINWSEKKNPEGSESILPYHPVNWPSLGLFGLQPFHSLIAVNTNEHLICSVMYLECWLYSLECSYTAGLFFQNSALTSAQSFLYSSVIQPAVCQTFSHSLATLPVACFVQHPQFTTMIDRLQHCLHTDRPQPHLCPLSYNASMLSVQSLWPVCYLCVPSPPFLMLCGDRCQWLC